MLPPLCGVIDSALQQGFGVTEVISGHGTAGQPLRYQLWADPGSAVCAAPMRGLRLVFLPVCIRLSFRRFHRASINSPVSASAHAQHLHTQEDEHYAVALSSSLQPRSCDPPVAEESRPSPDHKSANVNTLKTEKGPLQMSAALRRSLDPLLKFTPLLHTFPPSSSPNMTEQKQETCTSMR